MELNSINNSIEQARSEIRLDYTWQAVYGNGEQLKQFDELGEHSFGEIDLSKIVFFHLVSTKSNTICFSLDIKKQAIIINGVIFFVEFPIAKYQQIEKSKMVFFRRVRHEFLENGTKTTIRYVIGFQSNIDGRNTQQYLFVNNDGSFTLSQQK